MKIEEHEESFKEHKDTIFRWALEVKGIENSQRIIGLHAARAIIDLLSIYLLKKGKISSGKQINHRWFKSQKASGKLPEFNGKTDVVNKIVEIELLCEKLSYGSKKAEDEIKKALSLFNELENHENPTRARRASKLWTIVRSGRIFRMPKIENSFIEQETLDFTLFHPEFSIFVHKIRGLE